MLGGGALILGDGKNGTSPLTVDGLAKGGIKYVVAVPKTQLSIGASQLNWDPAAENFGQPDFYELQTAGNRQAVRLHWSRVIIFKGNPYPDPMQVNDPWSDSCLQRLFDAFRDAGLAMQSAAQMVEEAKVDIMTMEDLATHLSSEDSNTRLMERMRLFKLGKTTFNLALMGGREEFSSKSMQFGNLDKVLYAFLQVASGASDIPATRFLAQSPAGMNSTGESDLRNYASLIAAKQDVMRRTSLKRLDELLLKHALGTIPKTWWYEWVSIWEMSPKEAAETNKANSEADNSYANSGMIPTAALEKAVINRMVESGLYPGLDEAMQELSAAELEQVRPEPAPIQEDPNVMAKLNAGVDPAAAGAE
jgi:phage-related protein (TIGR01555 family)